jgi:hypothetical protein
MANGFFAQGFARGSDAANQRRLQGRQVDIQKRGQDLRERQFARQEQLDLQARAQQNFQELQQQLMQSLEAASILAETNPEAAANFAQFAETLKPKLQFLAPAVGRSPEMVNALILQAENRAAIGRAQAIEGAETEALAEAGVAGIRGGAEATEVASKVAGLQERAAQAREAGNTDLAEILEATAEREARVGTAIPEGVLTKSDASKTVRELTEQRVAGLTLGAIAGDFADLAREAGSAGTGTFGATAGFVNKAADFARRS